MSLFRGIDSHMTVSTRADMMLALVSRALAPCEAKDGMCRKDTAVASTELRSRSVSGSPRWVILD
jgi:hypothetical protein